MLIDVTKHALMITSFVLMMMLLIEYINVQTRGEWQKSLKKSRFGQYFLAAFLGVVLPSATSIARRGEGVPVSTFF